MVLVESVHTVQLLYLICHARQKFMMTINMPSELVKVVPCQAGTREGDKPAIVQPEWIL